MIADGYSAELDELRGLQSNAGEYLVALEARSAHAPAFPTCAWRTTRRTATTSRSPIHADKIPVDYRRRQTLKNAERYITPELKAFEDKALSARDRAWRSRSRSTKS